MIYYFLPDPGLFGGVKVACMLIEDLIHLGVKAVAVLPEGKAPQWFSAAFPVISEEEAFQRIGEKDWIMITWPPDYHRLRSLPAKLVCHCQGTDDLMAPIFADPSVLLLTCWQQAENFVRQHFDRSTVNVGISITDCFFYDATVKRDNRAAYMPRRGFPLVRACIHHCSGIDFDPIDGLDEREVSTRLKKAGIFLATSIGEQFGLPALEAMAAGCLVLSVPVKGGMEYLHHDRNCLVVEPGELAAALQDITRPARQTDRIRLRSRAVSTAFAYRRGKQQKLLKTQLAAPLQCLLS